MESLEQTLNGKSIALPDNVVTLLRNCRRFQVFDTTAELAQAATQGAATFTVTYEVPGKGQVVEAEVVRVRNGISANYPEPYMRRRDPQTMAIADDKPTDKARFADKYGYEFEPLQSETLAWLAEQELAVFFYLAGRKHIGSLGIAIAPANAGFFAMGLSMLQQIVAVDDLPHNADVRSVIFVAPTFRHTHFEGKQVVVHNRTDTVHELYSYKARCPLLGYELTTLSIEGSKIPSRFLQIYNQVEVGEAGYDAGAAILREFFHAELPRYLESDLHPAGRRIIEACLDDAAIEDYNRIIPMSFEYEYAFTSLADIDSA